LNDELRQLLSEYFEREFFGFRYYLIGLVLSSGLVVGLFFFTGDTAFSKEMLEHGWVSFVYFCMLTIPFVSYVFCVHDSRVRGSAKLFEFFRFALSLFSAILLFWVGIYVEFFNAEAGFGIVVPICAYIYMENFLAAIFGKSWHNKYSVSGKDEKEFDY